MIRPKLAMVVLVALIGSYGTPVMAVTGSEFVDIVNSMNCDKVISERAFSLRVLGWSFPIGDDIDFFGFELSRAVFRTVAPPHDHNLPRLQLGDDGPLVDRVLAMNAMITSIAYGDVQENQRRDDDLRNFEAIEWRGLQLYFRSTVGGRTVRTTTYQLIVRGEDQVHELTITVVDPYRAAQIIGCAQEL